MKFGDICSGLGCVGLAMREIIGTHTYEFAADIDPNCRYNLRHNFSPEVWHDDIKNITSLPKVDLFSAGFPCQPFSSINNLTNGVKHPKHDLFTDVLRCLKLCDPEIFILENVKGLLFKSNTEYFKYICKCLDETGYNWAFKLMNSKNYGTPQSRSRVYFVGKKKGVPVFPVECPLSFTIADIIDTTLPMTIRKPTLKVREALRKVMIKENEGIVYIDNAQSGGNFIKLYELSTLNVIPCLIASHPFMLYKYKDNEIYERKLTCEETEQFQNIEAYDNICSENQYMRMIGNGMDVSMMQKLIALNTLK